MKLRPRWPLALLLLGFLLLGSRLIWTLGVSADNWRLLGDEWIAQTRSLVNWEIPVSYQTPADQAAYWVQQSQEIEAAQNDPQVALGAAWMLDTPCRFYQYHTEFDQIRSSYRSRLQLGSEHETVEARENDFELRTRKACLKQSELATQLDPENKYLWRNRALLLFQFQNNAWNPSVFYSPHSIAKKNWLELYKFIPRTENWQAILDECAQHDPENALYDYLAAIYLSSVSTQKNSLWQTEILDHPKYKLAQHRLRAGLKKPFLKTGFTGQAATFAFLSHTTFTMNQQLQMAESRKNNFREKYILCRLFQILDQEYNSDFLLKQYNSLGMYFRDYLKVSQQLSDGPAYDNFAKLGQDFYSHEKVKLITLNQKFPGLFEPTEYEAVLTEFRQVLQNQKTYNKAIKQIEKGEKYSPNDTPHFFRLALLSATSLNLIIISLTCAMLTGVLSWFGTHDPNSECVGMGFWRPLVCWLLGTGISLVLWGLCTVQKNPLKIDYQSLLFIHWTGYILFVLGLLYLIHAGFSVPWLQLLGISFLMALLVLILYSSLILFSSTSFIQLCAKTSQAYITPLITLSLLFTTLSLHQTVKFFREKLHSQKVSLLICGLILGIAAIMVPYVLKPTSVEQIPVRLRVGQVYPLTWFNFLKSQMVDGELSDVFGLINSTTTRVWLTWYRLTGDLFAAFISVSLLLLWYLKRQSRMIMGGFPQLLQTRKRIALHHTGRMLSQSCVIAALLFSLVYLAVAPDFLQATQTQILKNYQRLEDCEVSQKKTRTIQAEIAADTSYMNRLREEAANAEELLAR
ncbi:hypothetical protein [uncultured Gimesia sp.]|uniref:hypothetical protein n=1 Tax=uncultured Gimesia sp. TaxID=1678688 RepID=UPI0030D8EE0C|tara:strand:+ start:121594 stop:123993 length:2400 start_codon:yes stop_codon:yes gene_type:complete